MIRIIEQPVHIAAHGSPPKHIEEFVGRLASGHDEISIARMVSPPGWSEPGQTPRFTEYTVVLRGRLRVQTRWATYDLHVGQAVVAPAGQWVRYSTPQGAEYLALCVPAFSPRTVRRDADATPAPAPTPGAAAVAGPSTRRTWMT
jgi:quercetin dioxygenase-like cupin family protein